MENFTIDQAKSIYGIDSWGANYFDINEDGHLVVCPSKNLENKVSLVKVIEELQKSRLKTPLLVRFPQILESQVKALTHAFESAIVEYQYKGLYQPVFPIKVNQQACVVHELLDAGYEKRLGIEVGSKPELMAALGLDLNPMALTICNGFKDREYLEMVSLGVQAGRKIIVVIEKPFELDSFFEMHKAGAVLPYIGFRVKLHAKGSGMWEKSGGQASKFGLSMSQLIHSIDLLKKAGLLDRLKMFHYHIGSQITDIRKIKEAIKEAARIYAKSKKLGAHIEYLNVGGGLGVDYDGSKTSSDASVNYSVHEYANDVVYTIMDVCNNEHVPHPTIVSESGRFLVAYHSVLVADVRGQFHEMTTQKPQFDKNESRVIDDMLYINENISVKNYREFYHDAIERRDEMNSLFNLGMLELEDRGKGEWLFWNIAKKAVKLSKTAKFVADEFVELEQRLFEKMVCNFSVFQSIPDHWALDQLFPIVPISRLNEKPDRVSTVVDITCDSDGEVDKFVDLKDIKNALEVHTLNSESYHLAFLMIGAYQDTMGDLHNLFGAVNEAHVVIDPSGKMMIQNTKKGDLVEKTITMYGYEKAKLLQTLNVKLEESVKKQLLSEKEAKVVIDKYNRFFQSYPYLT